MCPSRRRPARGPLHQDPGLQPERTLLSWTRTLLLMLVVGGFFIRWAPYYGAAVLWLFGAACLIAGSAGAMPRRAPASPPSAIRPHWAARPRWRWP